MGTKVAADHQHHHVKAVGRRIARAREEREWSPSELARVAGIHRSEVSLLERGAKPRVTAHVLAAIARALGMTLDALWWGQTPPASPLEKWHELGAALRALPLPPSGASTKPPRGGGASGRPRSGPSSPS